MYEINSHLPDTVAYIGQDSLYTGQFIPKGTLAYLTHKKCLKEEAL